MHRPSPTLIDVLISDLDDNVAAGLLTLLRALTDTLEAHHAAALARQHQRELASRQPSLWPDDDPPF